MPAVPLLRDLDLSALESPAVLRAAIAASRQLAELKGVLSSVPDQTVLAVVLGLQEAKDSAALDGLVASYDDLLRSTVADEGQQDPVARQAVQAVRAAHHGFARVRTSGRITGMLLLELQGMVEGQRASYRTRTTGLTMALMADLETFTNGVLPTPIDPLVRMAIVQWQYDRIAPFESAPGRVGRMLTPMAMGQHDLLASPLLLLSRAHRETRATYDRLALDAAHDGAWEPWLRYWLSAVESAAQRTRGAVADTRAVMKRSSRAIRRRLAYADRPLVRSLFAHPYTKIEFLMADLRVSRPTAKRYLDGLVSESILTKYRVGRVNYYVNEALCAAMNALDE